MRKKKSSVFWRKLDNTANIFPVIANQKISHVFRLSATLEQTINPDILQQALEDVLPWFDGFRVRLRRGIFWFYFEENKRRPLVEKEDTYPCRYIDTHVNQRFLFRVTYYKNRINLEVFHALSDGLGAITFLKEITYRYLDLVRTGDEAKPMTGLRSDLLDTEDSYTKNYKKRKVKGYSTAKAYEIKDAKLKDESIDVTHGYLNMADLKRVSKSYGVSITKYLAAVMVWSIYNEYLGKDGNKRPICLNLPVNLRAFFDSQTMSNFFAVTILEFFATGKDHSFEEVLEVVSTQMDQKIGKEQAEEIIAYNVSAEKNPFVRIAPLFIKNFGMGIVFKRSSKATTMTLSNLGKIDVLPEYEDDIVRFHAMMGVFEGQEMKCTVLSHKDETVVTFTSVYKKPRLQETFFHTIEEHGIGVTQEGNNIADHTKEQKDTMYPKVESKAKKMIGLKNIFFILGILASAICVLVNALTYREFWWSAIVVGCIGYIMVTISYSILHHSNVAAKIVVEVLVGALLTIGIDVATGNYGWAISYAAPGFVLIGSIAIATLMAINQKEWFGYILYQLMNALFAVILLGISCTSLVEHPLVSYICTGISVGIMIITFALGYRDGKDELIRRFRP